VFRQEIKILYTAVAGPVKYVEEQVHSLVNTPNTLPLLFVQMNAQKEKQIRKFIMAFQVRFHSIFSVF